MRFKNEFLTILNIRINADDLTLRLDIGDFFQMETYKDQVVEIKLINCKDVQNEFEKFKRLTGELIWNYAFLESENLFKVLMEADAGEVEIKCREITEEKSDLTIDELLLKFQYLDKNYQRESQDRFEAQSKYGRLRDLLTFELKNDLEKWEKRREFFKINQTEKIEKAEAVIKFGTKLLNFIEQIDQEEK